MNECLKTLVIIYLFYNGLNICLCHGMHFNIPSIFGNCFLHPFFNSCTYKKTQTNNNIPSPNHPTPSHPTSTQPLNTTATGKHWGMVLSGWVVKYFGLFGGEEGVASILFRISNSFLAIEFYTPPYCILLLPIFKKLQPTPSISFWSFASLLPLLSSIVRTSPNLSLSYSSPTQMLFSTQLFFLELTFLFWALDMFLESVFHKGINTFTEWPFWKEKSYETPFL